MVTIARITEKLLEDKPFIQEALARGLINNAALAQEITPAIEKEIKHQVKFSAVNMAIRRLGEKLEQNFTTKAKFQTDQTNLIIHSDLVEIVLYKQTDTQKYIQKIYALINVNKGDILTITQGMHEIMVITNQKNYVPLTKNIPQHLIKKIIRKISSITIQLSEKDTQTLGLFYLASRALNWENINIIDIVSTYTEMTFIIKEDDTAKAFNCLHQIIKK